MQPVESTIQESDLVIPGLLHSAEQFHPMYFALTITFWFCKELQRFRILPIVSSLSLASPFTLREAQEEISIIGIKNRKGFFIVISLIF
jgi:hypothetical protein